VVTRGCEAGTRTRYSLLRPAEMTREFVRLLREHLALYRVQELAVARQCKLPRAQLRCLAEFADEPELTVKELTRRLRLSHSRLSHLLDWLEVNGLISRRINPEDRRIIIVRITSKGRALVEVLEARLECCIEPALRAMPRHATEVATAVLARALETAREAAEASSRRRA
jgi:DNA-binding MarR family transcriptional regulator